MICLNMAASAGALMVWTVKASDIAGNASAAKKLIVK
jgi:hypothetical protein